MNKKHTILYISSILFFIVFSMGVFSIFGITSYVSDSVYSYINQDTGGEVAGEYTVGMVATSNTYYVSNSGDNNNSGLSESFSWRSLNSSIAKLKAGDTLKLRRGDVWRGRLDIKVSGGNNNPITITSYGTGDKPLILGSVSRSKESDWSKVVGENNIWQTNVSSDVGNIYIEVNGNMLNPVKDYKRGYGPFPRSWNNELEIYEIGWSEETKKNTGEINEQWEFKSVGSKLIMYSTANPASLSSNIEISVGGHLVNVSARNIVIENIAVKYANAHCVSLRGVDGVTIRDSYVGYCGGIMRVDGESRFGNGIEFWGSAQNSSVINCYVEQTYDDALTNQNVGAGGNQTNILYRNNHVEKGGIGFQSFNRGGNTKNIHVLNNVFKDTGKGWSGYGSPEPHGIRRSRIYHGTGSIENFVLEGNIFDGSYQWGISVGKGDFILKGNIFKNADLAGVVFSCNKDKRSNTIFYNNLFYGNKRGGIKLLNCLNSDLKLYNNTFANNGKGSFEFAKYYGITTQKSIWKNNIFYNNYNNDNPSVSKNTFINNNCGSDPLFVNANNNDYRLKSNSPCIDKGVDVGFTYVGSAPDIGAYEYGSNTLIPDSTGPSCNCTSWQNDRCGGGSCSSTQMNQIRTCPNDCSNVTRCAPNTGCNNSAPPALFVGDFEDATGGLSAWTLTKCCNYSLTRITSPVRSGQYALRTEVHKTDADVGNSKRSEVRKNGAGNIGDDLWYGFSIYLPNDWVKETGSTPEIVAQWHAPSSTRGGPPVHLKVYQDRWMVGLNWDPSPIASPNTPTRDSADIWDAPYEKGKWVDWVFHIRWGYDDSGLLEVWKDGQQIIDRDGANTYNDEGQVYFKMGVYKWVWKKRPDESNVDKRIIYHDEFRIGKSYASVAPPGSSPPPTPPTNTCLSLQGSTCPSTQYCDTDYLDAPNNQTCCLQNHCRIKTADLNCSDSSHKIGFKDLTVLIAYWGEFNEEDKQEYESTTFYKDCGESDNATPDLNKDGEVDIDDFALFLNQWSK